MLEARQMRGVGDSHESRPRYFLRESGCYLYDLRRIRVAYKDQCGAFDLAEPPNRGWPELFFRMRITRKREVILVNLPRTAPIDGIDPRNVATRTVKPQNGLHLSSALDFSLFCEPHELGPAAASLIGPFVPSTHARSHSEQSGNSIRMFEREIDSGQPSHGASDERGLLNLEELQNPSEIGAIGIRQVDHLGLTEAAQIIADDVEPFSDIVELRIPHPPVRYARMDEDHSRTKACAFETDPRTVRLCKSGFEVRACRHLGSPERQQTGCVSR